MARRRGETFGLNQTRFNQTDFYIFGGANCLALEVIANLNLRLDRIWVRTRVYSFRERHWNYLPISSLE